MNKLFQQLTTQPSQNQAQAGNPLKTQEPLPSLKNNLNQIQNLLNNNSDPSSIVQNLILQNPKMKNVMNLFQSSGMTPKQFFYNYAQQKGIDPDQFLKS